MSTVRSTSQSSPSRSKELLALGGFVVASFAVAAIGGLSTDTGAWYDGLDKPAGNPPSWLFGPVWTVLYGMIAVSGWLVWRQSQRTGASVRIPLTVYAVQLGLNLAWSLVFFGAHRTGLGLVVIIALDIAVTATMLLFAPVHRIAALLLVPYLAWILFATYLNAGIVVLN